MTSDGDSTGLRVTLLTTTHRSPIATRHSPLTRRSPSHLFADLDKGTADEWIPRDPGLIRLTGRHPFNCEPTVKRNSEGTYRP